MRAQRRERVRAGAGRRRNGVVVVPIPVTNTGNGTGVIGNGTGVRRVLVAWRGNGVAAGEGACSPTANARESCTRDT